MHYWKPLFYWLLDIAITNSYLLAKDSNRSAIEKSKDHRDHWRFQEALAKGLMIYSKTPEHNQICRPTRAYCVYCQKNKRSWEPKHQQRAFETNITNIEG